VVIYLQIHKIKKRWRNIKKRRLGARDGNGKGNQKITAYGN